MVYLHALPYVLVISSLFYLCFWGKGEAKSKCCGGTWIGCFALIMHTVFWLVCFVITTILAVVSYGVKNHQQDIPIVGLAGEPNLDEVLQHIEKEYPEFWNLVLKDAGPALGIFFVATWVFWAFCLYIAVYAWGVICCKPYKAPKEDEPKKGENAA